MQRPRSETVTLDDVVITEELSRRSPRSPNLQAENQAMRTLAQQMVNAPEIMLQSLVDMAVELCGAGTAGVSLLETTTDGEEVFRWNVLAGTLAQYVGGTTPPNFSPCGVCLDRGSPQLFAHPERYFTYFQVANTPFVEGLVLPLIAENHALGTIWIVSHDEQRHFDPEDVRVMTSLADFTATTLLLNQRQTGELLAANAALEAEIVERKRAEAESREAQRRLELSLSGANLGVWTYSVGTDEFWADDRAKRMHGHEPHEVHNFAEAGANIHPEDRDRAQAAFAQAIQERSKLQIEYRVVWRDGSVHWIASYAEFIPSDRDEGKFYGVAQDISDRKFVEAALHESEARSRALIENLPGGAAFVVDHDLRYLLAEGEALSAAGFKPEDLVGQTIFEVMPPELVAHYEMLYRKALAGESFEHEHNAHDRSYISRGTPLRSANGEVYAALAISYDISDRKQAEAALAHSRRQFEKIAATTPDLVYVFDLIEERNTYVNEGIHRVLGYSQAQIATLGSSLIGSLIHPDDIPGVIEGNQRFRDLDDREVYDHELRMRHATGEYRWLRCRDAVFERTADGTVTQTIGTAQDVTDRKRAEAALRESEARQAFLLRLSDVLRSLADPVDIQETVTRTAMNYFGADRCYYCEIEDGNVIISRDASREDLPSIAGVYPLSSFAIFQAVVDARRPFIVQDVHTTDTVDEDLRRLCIQLQVISYVDVPVIKNGKPVGILCLVQSTPRDWTDLEVELAVETADRTWTAIERAHAEAALAESEEKYRTLFESVDEGYLLCEVIFDENDKPVDIFYIEANPAAVRLAGRDFAGRRMREIDPHYEEYWYEIIGRVALTGESVRTEHYAEPHGRWFDFIASRVGGQQSHRVASIFQDITERKERERQQEFLLKFSDHLRTLPNAEAIENAGVRLLAEFLNLDRVYIATVNRLEDRAAIGPEYRRPDLGLVPVSGELNMSDFPEGFRQVEEQTLVVDDIADDSTLSERDKQSLGAINLTALVVASVRKGERNVFWSLVASTTTARKWTEDEVRLIETVAERTWAAVERARAEAALHESEARRHLALDAAEMGTFLYHPQEDRGEPDARMLALFGLREGDTLNLAEALAKMIHPGDREVYAAAVAKAVNPNSDGKLYAEIRVIHPDESLHWVAVTAQTVFEGDPPQPVRMYGTAADITDRKRAEAALRQSEQKLQSAITVAQLSPYEWNPITGELKWDARLKAMWGLPVDAQISYEIHNAGIHPQDREYLERQVAKAIDPNGDGIFEAEFRTVGIEDKIERWVSARGQTVFDEQGRPVHYVGAAQDVTDRKQAEADRIQLIQEQASRLEAERMNQLKDEFLAMVSHELQSPMVAILGWTRLLRANPPAPAMLRKSLKTIERNATLQAKLIQDLLDISRITAGKLRLSLQPIELKSVIETAIAAVETAAIVKNISLQYPITDQATASVMGDRDRLQQIFCNLLSNAIKFTSESGSVTIELSTIKNENLDYAEIRVSDTGIGIAAEFLPHVFDRFRQAEKSGSSGGLGLGLAIARHLVELHNGTIHAASLGAGQGATFTVKLPILQE